MGAVVPVPKPAVESAMVAEEMVPMVPMVLQGCCNRWGRGHRAGGGRC